MLKFTLIILSLITVFGSPLAAAKDNGADQMPPTLVEATIAKRQPWQKEVQATGSLVASQGIMVKPEIEGRVTKIFFNSGEYVQANTPLLQMNPDILKAQLDYANAQYTLSQSDYKRAEDLYKKRVLSASELDKALANLNSNKANAEKAQAQLNQTLIRAPFSGRLGLNLVNLGDYISAGQNIVNLQATDPMRVDFSIPEIYLKDLALGQAVVIHSDSFPHQTFSGNVYAFDSVINPNTRSLAMRANIPNRDQKLVPGTFVEVSLYLGNKENLITVPQTAIVSEGDSNYVYKINNNHARKTEVKPGSRKGDQVAILSGLADGDWIITAGQIKIHQDDAPVMIRK